MVTFELFLKALRDESVVFLPAKWNSVLELLRDTCCEREVTL